MFSTCINCHAPLGANQVIEHFPVGRKLAFDAAKGRLWVVCLVCRQWNLSPLDERWEAIEEAERLFRSSRLRASTDRIGLARLADGTEAIRVGPALRPEFAAWRYGQRFKRRWMRNAPTAAIGGGLFALGKAVSWGPILQFATGPALALGGFVLATRVVRRARVVARLTAPGEPPVLLTQAHIESMRFVPDDSPAGWHLRVQRPPVTGRGGAYFRADHPEMVLHGADAERVAARLLPRLNRVGGRTGAVDEAVKVLDRYGDPEGVFRKASRYDVVQRKRSRIGAFQDQPADDPDEAIRSDFARAPASIRLAVEMAVHEAQERALIEGELDDLTDQWREAEEVAAIADALTLPPSVLAQLERLRLR